MEKIKILIALVVVLSIFVWVYVNFWPKTVAVTVAGGTAKFQAAFPSKILKFESTTTEEGFRRISFEVSVYKGLARYEYITYIDLDEEDNIVNCRACIISANEEKLRPTKYTLRFDQSINGFDIIAK